MYTPCFLFFSCPFHRIRAWLVYKLSDIFFCDKNPAGLGVRHGCHGVKEKHGNQLQPGCCFLAPKKGISGLQSDDENDAYDVHMFQLVWFTQYDVGGMCFLTSFWGSQVPSLKLAVST